MKSKIELLNNMNEYARSKDSSVKQVTASLLAEKKNVELMQYYKLCFSQKLHTWSKSLLIVCTIFVSLGI